MQVFHHEPLEDNNDQIRLIRCLPRTEASSQIQCQLSTFRAATCPKYSALSYTWGPPTPTHEILVNGQLFTIRENLFQFFNQGVHIESLDIDYIFIDQICINQQDILEVNAMVQRMPMIYSSAWQVVAWLGSEHPIAPHGWRHMSPAFTWDILRDGETKWWFTRLCGQVYFDRLWVVQELVRARQFSLLYDGRMLNSKDLCDILDDVMQGSPEWPLPINSYAIRLFVTVRDVRFSDADGSMYATLAERDLMENLTLALYSFSHLQCHDMKDKVYGLLGTVKPADRIQVEYSKTAAEVYWAAVEAVSDVVDERHAETFSHLGKSMDVSGNEGAAVMTSRAIEQFSKIFAGRSPVDVFACDSFEDLGIVQNTVWPGLK